MASTPLLSSLLLKGTITSCGDTECRLLRNHLKLFLIPRDTVPCNLLSLVLNTYLTEVKEGVDAWVEVEAAAAAAAAVKRC